MDPATIIALTSLIRFGVEVAQQYANGTLSTGEVQALLTQAGINVDNAINAWNASGATPSPILGPSPPATPSPAKP